MLASNGHDVAYFSVDEDQASSSWREFFPKAPNYRSASLFTKVSAFPAAVYSAEAKRKMLRLINIFKPEVIHAFAVHIKLSPSVLDAARLSGVPVVMSCNDYKHICPNYKLYHSGGVCEECKGGKFYRCVVNRCCQNSFSLSAASMVEAYCHQLVDIYRRNVHTFLFSSEFMAKKTEEFWGASSFRWRLLRNPFESKEYSASFSPNGGVLFFGRLVEEKGVDVLVRAASLLPEVEFRVVGDGPDFSALQSLSRSLGVENLSFIGPKWGERINEEIRACRFVVVPSVWHENFPYVINQAFAHGKPVVGSDRGGIPELVLHGERGLIYEADDPSSLAGAIKSLYFDLDSVRRMGENAKIYSDERFNDEHFYSVLMDIYDSVVL